MHTDPCTLNYYSPFHNIDCLSASQRPCAGSLKTSPWCQWKIKETSGRRQDIAGGSDVTEDKYLEVMLGTHPFSVSLPLLLRTIDINNPLPHSWKQSRCSQFLSNKDKQPGAGSSKTLRCSKLLLLNKLFVSGILAGIESVPLQGETSYM